MQDSSAFQYIAIDTIHESTTNPRRTFEESKLHELAESIRQHGLIQPITVRPNHQGFEIVGGARRYRAAQLAELFSVPARIVDIGDAQAQEWQIVENSLRIDVHPYDEATGYRRLLDLPGYEVATIAERTGKSASHVYARLSLLQLIPADPLCPASRPYGTPRHPARRRNRLPRRSRNRLRSPATRKDGQAWENEETHPNQNRFQGRAQQESSQKENRSLKPTREPDHRLPRLFQKPSIYHIYRCRRLRSSASLRQRDARASGPFPPPEPLPQGGSPQPTTPPRGHDWQR